MSTEHAIVPLPCPRDAIPRATHVRGALIATSLELVRSFHLESAYLAALPAEHHDVVRSLAVASWIPMDVACAHYAAIDTLALAKAAIFEMGRQSATRIHGSQIRAIVERLRAAGEAEPVALLAHLPAVLERIVLGGTAAVFRVAPGEVRAELHGVPALRHEYLRHGWAGAFHASVELVARRVQVVELHERRTESSVAYRIAWI